MLDRAFDLEEPLEQPRQWKGGGEMGMVCSMHGTDEKYIQNFGQKT